MTRIGLSLVIAVVLLQAPATRAAQLDKDSCSNLKSEQTQLEQGGARGSLERGPEWAKANLAPEKLEQVRRLIEVDEQLLFRCGGRPLVILPSEPDPAALGEGESKEGGKEAPASAPKAPPAQKKAVPAKKAAGPPPAPPAAAKEAEDKKAAAAKATKAKARKKDEDAYSPSAADWITNPFAGALAPVPGKK